MVVPGYASFCMNKRFSLNEMFQQNTSKFATSNYLMYKNILGR